MGVVFNTDKRIKMGVWGLGRGKRIVDEAKILNIDVVAGCDINPHMRENFMRDIPGAFVTGDENEFLAQDFDVVLIATFIFDHARHTIKALEAGKHVLCEVTPFITPAEGVQVVEAVEKSGNFAGPWWGIWRNPPSNGHVPLRIPVIFSRGSVEFMILWTVCL